MFDECYIELVYFVLSIPIIYILYVCSLITKETTKRKRDRIYCKNDIMEIETLRYYVSNGDRKNNLRNILITASIFMVVVLFCTGLNNRNDQFIIFFIIFLLASLLLDAVVKSRAQKTDEYEKKMDDIRISISNKEDKYQDFFSKLPEEFLLEFIEKWNFIQNKKDFKTFENRKQEIIDYYGDFKTDTAITHLIGLMRPYENDIKKIHKIIRIPYTDQKLLPQLTEYEYDYNTSVNIEIIAWIMLAFIYYNIFHTYYQNTDMFVEIITAILISMIIITFVYYLVIMKDEL